MAVESTLTKIDRIKVYVVSKNDEVKENCSETLLQCVKLVRKFRINHEWISEENCFKLHRFDMYDVFVVDDFEGKLFDHLSNHPSNFLIVSPEFLIQSLSEGNPIPYRAFPLFSRAMNGLFITFSSVTKNKKDAAKNRIRYMCGNYNDDLVGSTTHLVVSNIMSEKYFKACECGIPVMIFDWVDAVWQDCHRESSSTRAIDRQYDNYKCPIFYKANISIFITGDECENVANLINQNGGICTSEILTENTEVLVTNDTSTKFVHAKKRGIHCVKPSWIFESITKGYAIRFDQHLLPKSSYSSTTNEATNSTSKHMSATHINRSCTVTKATDSIYAPPSRATINSNGPNLVRSKLSSVACITPKKQKNDRRYQQVLNEIDIFGIKKCGPILDGCKVYLSGFSLSEEDKLRSVLNYGGALRFADLNESITHVIVGNFTAIDEEKLNSLHNSPYVVKLDWLKHSIDKGCILPEQEYHFGSVSFKTEVPFLQQQSPLSKKGLQILTPKKNQNEEILSKKVSINVNRNLIDEYSQPSGILNHMNINDEYTTVDGPKISNKNNDEMDNEEMPLNSAAKCPNEETNFFNGLLFKVTNHDDEMIDKIRDRIINHGGCIKETASQTIVDYVIVPIGDGALKRSFPSSEVVTFLWLNECIHSKRVVPISYYHEPLIIPQFKSLPLLDCVLTFSQYDLAEKMFLEHVAVALGAACQDVLSRKENKIANAAKTTHLICEVVNSVKYKAAKKWNLPIVKKNWLLDCFKFRKKLIVDDYVPVDRDNLKITDKQNESDSSKKLTNASSATSNEDRMNLQYPTVSICEPTSVNNDGDGNDGSNANFDVEDNANDGHIPAVVKNNRRRVSSPATYREIQPKFHSTMVMPIEQQQQSERESKPKSTGSGRSDGSISFEQYPPFPPLKDLSYNSPKDAEFPNEPNNCKMNRVNDLKRQLVTTHCTITATVSAVITTNSNSKTDLSTTFSNMNVSPSTAAFFGCKPANNVTALPTIITSTISTGADAGNKMKDAPELSVGKPSTPDGLLQQVKQISQLLTNATRFKEVDEINEQQVKTMYPFKDLHRREKRKMEKQDNPKVDWLDTCNFMKRMRPEQKCLRASEIKHDHNVLGQNISQPVDNHNDKYIANTFNEESSNQRSGQHERCENDEEEEEEENCEKIEKNFVLSNFSDLREKLEIEEAVKKLGGNIVTCSGFDQAVTHLIAKKLIKSEKILCCIAAGKWVLHPSYIKESEKIMQFLPETDYEWGNASVEKNDFTSQQLAEAATRWRRMIKSSRKQNRRPTFDYSSGAFCGMKATFWADRVRTGAFTRLIEAGGGTVLPVSKTLEATHLFVDNEAKYLTSIPCSFSSLAKKSIHVLPVTYLNDHLTFSPTPKPELYYVESYKNFRYDKS